ncbi:MAG: DNA ligase [candidate division WS2 bacterium ADurb.Bin280]|uniref:DNA ligase n=1 Tax=candidate division WS2 bacterium ADurb.Bin280 TaxID=1852829 RepID=A0A1V5SCY2_9BACT|nr:MAG: DNA ligase [candidate division WS2 bacterium ADurb.Bin280]
MAMDKEEARRRIEKLRKEIDENRYFYHVLDNPRVSDAVDDSLKHELVNLEQEHPDLITPDSPSQRVGGQPLDKFEKVNHKSPMLSLNDAFSKEELEKWQERLAKIVGEKNIQESEYYCELKMDGLAVALIYKNGILEKGATRGDGKTGEDVTNNLKTISSIPLKLREVKDFDLPSEIEIRGEVYLPLKDFEKLNQQQQETGQQVYANPRNIAAGSIRQLDPKIAASRNLQFMMYSIATDLNLSKHSQEHDLAKKLGFKTNSNNKICKNLDEVEEYIKNIEKTRESLPYQTDGIVVGINNKKISERLGVVGKAPRGQIAYKFPAQEATTLVKNIIVQVGRTGKLTPVAILEPIFVDGSRISRATLHNDEEINRKDIRIGDTVIIRKAGDVIPEVKEVIERLRNGDEKKFEMPKKCPVCGGSVTKKEGQVDWYCEDPNCSTIIKRKIRHFVSKGAFEVDGLGVKVVDKLFDEGIIKDQADIFKISKDDLTVLEGFAEKKASNIIESIKKSKKISLENFIYALGIRHVGRQMANDFAKQYGSLDRFIEIGEQQIDQMYGVGEEIRESVEGYLGNPQNISLIKRMLQSGVEVEDHQSPVEKNSLGGKSFVISGKLQEMTRDQAHKRIIQNGGVVLNSVSSKTNYLVLGEEPGEKKVKEAEKYGVNTINEREFISMIGS